MYPIYKYTTMMMRSHSSLLYNFSLFMAGMWVDYYGWVVVLGVGWQGWKQCLYVIAL
jgi:hypothetical protein